MLQCTGTDDDEVTVIGENGLQVDIMPDKSYGNGHMELSLIAYINKGDDVIDHYVNLSVGDAM